MTQEQRVSADLLALIECAAAHKQASVGGVLRAAGRYGTKGLVGLGGLLGVNQLVSGVYGTGRDALNGDIAGAGKNLLRAGVGALSVLPGVGLAGRVVGRAGFAVGRGAVRLAAGNAATSGARRLAVGGALRTMGGLGAMSNRLTQAGNWYAQSPIGRSAWLNPWHTANASVPAAAGAGIGARAAAAAANTGRMARGMAIPVAASSVADARPSSGQQAQPQPLPQVLPHPPGSPVQVYGISKLLEQFAAQPQQFNRYYA